MRRAPGRSGGQAGEARAQRGHRPAAEALWPRLKPGEVALLENVASTRRDHARQAKKNPDKKLTHRTAETTTISWRLGQAGHVYVNDAFGHLHRKARQHVRRGQGTKRRAALPRRVSGEKEIRDPATRPCPAQAAFCRPSGRGQGQRQDQAHLQPAARWTTSSSRAMAYTLLKARGVAVGQEPVENDQAKDNEETAGTGRRQDRVASDKFAANFDSKP